MLEKTVKKHAEQPIAEAKRDMLAQLDKAVAHLSDRLDNEMVELAKRVAALEGQKTLRSENTAAAFVGVHNRLDVTDEYTVQLSNRITKLEDRVPVSHKKHTATIPVEHLDTPSS